ncbi:MBL fold metallo-hydrolase [haloarchaeon 3A1-DGR]|nr:MBL fold metallo-hydrolase [haloarchaeon 3A1-DGR]
MARDETSSDGDGVIGRHEADVDRLAPGEFEAVRGVEDLYYHDTGMFDAPGYGSVYVYDTPKPAVIDTGTGANVDTLFETLSEIGIGTDDLAWILPTHVHLDHAGGAGLLADAYPEASVRVHSRGVRHLTDPSRLVEGTKAAVGDQWRHYADPEPIPEARVGGLAHGDTIDLGDRELEVLEAPGHAPHQTVFHEPDDGVVFTADAAGIYVPQIDAVTPTTPPPQFDLDQSLADAAAIADLDPSTLCFSHFGPRTFEPAVIEEFQRASVEWVEAVRRKREELESDEAVIRHFERTTELDQVWTTERAEANERLNVRGVLTMLDE